MEIPSVQFSSSDAAEGLIEIVDLEELYKRRNSLTHNPEEPHRLDFFLLLYVTEGTGAHFIDFEEWQFNGGDLLFVNKHQINAFDLSNNPKGSAILFTDTFIEKVQSNMMMPLFSPFYLKKSYTPILKASSSLKVSCDHLLSEIYKESNIAQNNSLTSMFLFSALFLMIERERTATQSQQLSKKENDTFHKFIALLETRFTETRNAVDYAEQLFVTYKTLNLLCKRITGSTAKQLIDAYTILEAKRRLVLGKEHVQKLAYELGFDEVTNFTKYFKKHTLMTPSQFKESQI